MSLMDRWTSERLRRVTGVRDWVMEARRRKLGWARWIKEMGEESDGVDSLRVRKEEGARTPSDEMARRRAEGYRRAMDVDVTSGVR